MKKRVVIMAAGLLLPLILVPLSRAGPLGQKKGPAIVLSGGYSLYSGGDLSQMVKDWKAFFAANAHDPQTGFDWSEIKGGSTFGIEVLYNLSKNIVLGLGTEYWQKKNTGLVNFTNLHEEQGILDSYPYEYSSQSSISFRPRNTLSIVPITLNAYYFLPVKERLRVFFKAGLSCYLSRLKSVYSYDLEEDEELTLYDPDDGSFLDTYLSETEYTFRYDDSFKKTAPGFHGGLGLEIVIIPGAGLLIEATYRQAELKNWKGTGTEELTLIERYGSESSGYTQNTENKSNTYSGQLVFISYPDGTSMVGIGDSSQNNSKQAVIKLSGPVLRVSIRFSF